MNEEDQEITSYDISVTEMSELRVRVTVGDKTLIWHFKVDQAFSFLILFVSALGTLAVGSANILLMTDEASGGEDPTGGTSPLH